MGKTGKKPERKNTMMTSPRSGASIPTGAHAKNTGGKKGRSGRKSIAFLTAVVAYGNDPRAQAALFRAACNPNSRGFSTAWQVLTKYRPEFRPARSMLADPMPAPAPVELTPGLDEVTKALLIVQKKLGKAGLDLLLTS